MVIQGRKIGSEYPPFIIAEAGINHNGNIFQAIKMAEVAKKCGADAVKFQTHIADAEMIPSHPLYEKIKSCELTEKEEIRLRNFCDKHEIIFLSTPYSFEAVDQLDNIGVPAYKIGSGECNNLPLVKYIASKGKPVILSTGMNSVDSMFETMDVLWDYGCQFVVLQCVSLYPTPYSRMHLNRVTMFDGISDHSVGIYTALGAVALGAVVVEKHFTCGWDCPDAEVSIEPDELRELVRGSKAIWEAMQDEGEDVNLSDADENLTKRWAFHSIVAKKDILAGKTLNISNLTTKRPGTGILASKWYEIIGKKAKNNIKMNSILRLEDID